MSGRSDDTFTIETAIECARRSWESQYHDRFDALERYVQERVPALESRVTNLEQLAVERIRRAEEMRYLDRIERLEQHLDRMADVVDGVFDVLCVMHPDSQALFETAKADAKAKLRILRGGRNRP